MINFNVYYDNNSQKKINKTENFLISSDLKSKIKIINDIPRFCDLNTQKILVISGLIIRRSI